MLGGIYQGGDDDGETSNSVYISTDDGFSWDEDSLPNDLTNRFPYRSNHRCVVYNN